MYFLILKIRIRASALYGVCQRPNEVKIRGIPRCLANGRFLLAPWVWGSDTCTLLPTGSACLSITAPTSDPYRIRMRNGDNVDYLRA